MYEQCKHIGCIWEVRANFDLTALEAIHQQGCGKLSANECNGFDRVSAVSGNGNDLVQSSVERVVCSCELALHRVYVEIYVYTAGKLGNIVQLTYLTTPPDNTLQAVIKLDSLPQGKSGICGWPGSSMRWPYRSRPLNN